MLTGWTGLGRSENRQLKERLLDELQMTVSKERKILKVRKRSRYKRKRMSSPKKKKN